MSPRIGRIFLNGINSFKNSFKYEMNEWAGLRAAKEEGESIDLLLKSLTGRFWP